MAASPADPRPFGGEVLCHPDLPGPASYDGAGFRFVFRPDPAEALRYDYALDVEARGLPPPERLASVLGPHCMQLWGELEVYSKLLDLPAHLALRLWQRGGFSALSEIASGNLEVLRADTAQHWCVIGRCEKAG